MELITGNNVSLLDMEITEYKRFDKVNATFDESIGRAEINLFRKKKGVYVVISKVKAKKLIAQLDGIINEYEQREAEDLKYNGINSK